MGSKSLVFPIPNLLLSRSLTNEKMKRKQTYKYYKTNKINSLLNNNSKQMHLFHPGIWALEPAQPTISQSSLACHQHLSYTKARESNFSTSNEYSRLCTLADEFPSTVLLSNADCYSLCFSVELVFAHCLALNSLMVQRNTTVSFTEFGMLTSSWLSPSLSPAPDHLTYGFCLAPLSFLFKMCSFGCDFAFFILSDLLSQTARLCFSWGTGMVEWSLISTSLFSFAVFLLTQLTGQTVSLPWNGWWWW